MTGVRRSIRPADVAILFRTRETHREFERALEAEGLRSYVYKGLGFFDADEIKDARALLAPGAAHVQPSRGRVASLALRAAVRRRPAAVWEPRWRRRSTTATRPRAPGPSDQQRLGAARTASARWRGLVDRIPPAELFDLVLRESAYAYEMRGPRFHQARENLKKLRALMRRMQNRGYATLTRLVAHLDRLAVGDESNAAIDAADAVNLMTIHAAKGLEFPVVFLVNLSRGTGNRREPIRVALEVVGVRASVSVGDFQSEADEDRAGVEREETKRLLYVALTRARDRLYLSSLVKDGRCPTPAAWPRCCPRRCSIAWRGRGGRSDVAWRASSGTHAPLPPPAPA